MQPAFVVLNMYQGQTFADQITLEDKTGAPLPLNSTYAGARMQVRPYRGGPLILELTTTNGRITLDDLGHIIFNVTAADTAMLPSMYDYEQWVYDLELYTSAVPAVVNRPIMGCIVFWPEITTSG